MNVACQPPAVDAPAEFRWPVRVYYEDTDAIGVVYYANYLKFCERARTEYLRAAGFDQHQLQQQRGLVFVVRSVQADFLASAELDDQLSVVTRIERLRGASLEFVQQVERQGEQGLQILFRATVSVACLDQQRKKPAPMPKDIRAQLETMQ